jgi:FkbM family methyltransferase
VSYLLNLYRLLRSPFRLLLSRNRFVHFKVNRKSFIIDREDYSLLKFSILSDIDYHTIEAIFTSEEYNLFGLNRASEIISYYRKLITKDIKPLIIDCGANIGAGSIYFSRCFPNALILAIEPEKVNFLTLSNNCAPYPMIEVMQAGVGPEIGFAKISNSDDDNNAFRLEFSANRKDIELTSIDAILQKKRLSLPFIIKIDIEGFEKALFSKNTDWVSKFPIIIIEPHDWMLPKVGVSQNLLRILAKSDRDFIIQGENIISISNNFL